MDRLASFPRSPSDETDIDRHIEVRERLLYLAHQDTCGLMRGTAGSGKSALFADLAEELRRQGRAVIQLDLTGLSANDVPLSLAMRLGLGVDWNADPVMVWGKLQDHAEARRHFHFPLTVLCDHIERSDASAVLAVNRLVSLFHANCSWLFAGRDPLPGVWEQFTSERCWLKMSLTPLTASESGDLLAAEFHSRTEANVTAQAVKAAIVIAQGREQRLRHLAELAALAAQADDLAAIDAQVIHAVAQELT